MNTQKYTLLTPCVPTNMNGYECPIGWKSVGYTQHGSCSVGNVPGLGHEDIWRMKGWQRVCKKEVETSGDLALDCCSNVNGIADSIECKTAGYTPYSNTCNIIMKDHCSMSSTQPNPYRHEWNGMPDGQNKPIWDNCRKQWRYNSKQDYIPQLDKYCVSYLKNSPPNNYFATHDFNDYHHDYPKYSYTTPNWDNNFGYYPIRKPYHSYDDTESKNQNTYCAFYPNQCYKQF